LPCTACSYLDILGTRLVTWNPLDAIDVAIVVTPGSYVRIPARSQVLPPDIDVPLNHLGCRLLNGLMLVISWLIASPPLRGMRVNLSQ
jgi:hypothetical protein